MKNRSIFIIFCIISLIIFVIINININESKNKSALIKVDGDPGKPYSIKVLNDHDVMLIAADDTIMLFLEDAYEMQDEYVVYVNQ